MLRYRAPNSSLPPKRRNLAKTLKILCGISFLLALTCTIWFTLTQSRSATVDLKKVKLMQLEPPKDGDPIAIMHTTCGDLTYLLYPSECPNAVENFVQLAENGTYDNTYIFRVEQGIFFAGGAPNPDGSLSDEISNDAPQESVRQEITPTMWPLRGALCALKTKSDSGFFRTLVGKQVSYNGSRFLVANSISMTDDIINGLKLQGEDNPVAQAFIEHGGIPNYAQQITVFGQLFEGFDVLDAITDVALQGEEGSYRPAEDILITSVEIGEYAAKS